MAEERIPLNTHVTDVTNADNPRPGSDNTGHNPDQPESPGKMKDALEGAAMAPHPGTDLRRGPHPRVRQR